MELIILVALASLMLGLIVWLLAEREALLSTLNSIRDRLRTCEEETRSMKTRMVFVEHSVRMNIKTHNL